MPVIGIPVAELARCTGREIARGDLLRLLGSIGCDPDGFEVLGRVRCASCGMIYELVGKEEAPPRCDRCAADLRAAGGLERMPDLEVVRMELLAVRPDLFDPGGLARALRGYLSIETGLKSYPLEATALTLRLDPSVRRETSLRPFIACAVLENVTLDDDRLKILMKMQENLHWALGRDRKHASIGVYDLDQLRLGAGGSDRFDLEYTTEDPDAYAFIPLGSPDTGVEHRRSLRRILEEHPKGQAYAHLLAGFDRYPILRTREGLVLSMPPIINSEETKVRPESRRLFVDVTGTGRRLVHRALNILTTSVLELDAQAQMRTVRIDTPDGSETTPDLAPQEAWVRPAEAARILGVPLDTESMRTLLLRMRHGVGQTEGGRVRVLVPAYRNDILHERDLIEDIGIAYGYENFPRRLAPSQTVGKELPQERLSDRMRDVLIGLGFVEIMSLILTSPEQSDLLLERPPHLDAVVLENPISTEQTHLRTSLLPGLLQCFAHNRSHSLPQQIFEVGDVTLLDAKAETGAIERRHLGFGQISPRTGFEEIRALVEAVVHELELPLRLRAAPHSFLLEGRAAELLGETEESEIVWGVLGEVHPRVLERLGLQNPVILCEMTLPEGGRVIPYRSLG